MATVAKEEENQSKQHSEKITIQRDRSGYYGLHISNISAEVNEKDLRSLFESSGLVRICKIIKTVDHDRVAFVKFDNHEEAVEALKKLNNTKVGDKTITIRPAYESQKSRGSRYYRERHSSSDESLSNRRGHQKPAFNERTIPKDEKAIGEQKPHKEENRDVFYASHDVRHVNNPSNMNSVPTSSPGIKNGAQNLPGMKSDGNTSTQVYSTAMSSSERKYVQSPLRSRNPAQNFTGSQASYTLASSNSSSMISVGRPSPPRSCSYQHSPRQGVTSMNTTHNGYNYSGISNNTQTGNPYMMQSGAPNSQSNPSCEISKPMRDLRVSNPGIMYSPSNVSKWSVAKVIEYFNTQEECSKSMVDFLEEQEIDGNALMLLEQESLLHFMKLGPALKLLNLRDKLKH